jgi:hypothetical protein
LRRRRLHVGLACLAAVGLAACNEPRQDKGEPDANFRVSAHASFPGKQKLAKKSELRVTVRNEENRKVIPNIAVTVRGFDHKIKQADVADPNRPTFVINGHPAQIGGFPETQEAGPKGGETAYVGTWALGPLRPGKTKTFKWSVTAVYAGKYDVTYRVAAGLNGKAKAVAVSGGPVAGSFKGTVSGAAPASRIADDGKTVIQGTR